MTDRTDTGQDRAVRKLVKALARRCRPPLLLVREQDAGPAAALAAQADAVSGTAVHRAGTDTADGARFRTVVVAETLEHLSEQAGAAALAGAWERVRPGGRLIVTVPHERGGAGGAPTQVFTRRRLQALLEPLGRPQLATDQPYRWLVMCLERPGTAGRPPNRTRRDRYRATARLCRGRVIELGSGEGHLAGVLRKRGHDVVGVELSRAKVDAARALYPGIPFHACDILQLDLPAASFDTAVLAEVLEHVDDTTGDAMLERAWRLLRPGGRLVVSVPNEDCIPHRNHVREFDRRGLRRLLARWGTPRVATDQPFQWLMMYVDREGQP
jgi:2-polyprenyl-3-methyl-5-hydroxy-6-metoxy-1,4-benzoquinol methylase